MAAASAAAVTATNEPIFMNRKTNRRRSSLGVLRKAYHGTGAAALAESENDELLGVGQENVNVPGAQKPRVVRKRALKKCRMVSRDSRLLETAAKRAARKRPSAPHADEESSLSTDVRQRLRKVFQFLGGFSLIATIHTELKGKLGALQEKKQLMNGLEREAHVNLRAGNEESETRLGNLRHRVAELTREIGTLQAEMSSNIESSSHIRPSDLVGALANLGVDAAMADVESLLWEVDQDMDGAVNWKEFVRMYCECDRDRFSSTVPPGFELYNIAQFLMFDDDASGSIEWDESQQLLSARFGAARAGEEANKLYKRLDKDGDGRLELAEYLVVGAQHPSRTKAMRLRHSICDQRPRPLQRGSASLRTRTAQQVKPFQTAQPWRNAGGKVAIPPLALSTAQPRPPERTRARTARKGGARKMRRARPKTAVL